MTYDEHSIKLLIAKHFGVDASTMSNDSSFIKDLGGDSLDTIELVLEFEDKFGIEITEEVAESMSTVQDLLTYLKSVSQ